jgi:hypothetical protein
MQLNNPNMPKGLEPYSSRNITWLAILTILLFSHDFQKVLWPTLWAEDGTFWFHDAYDYGLASLVQPHTGYLQSLPRVTALLARLMPISMMPAWFLLVAIVVQMAPVALMIWRGADIMPMASARCGLILFYIGMPNGEEAYLNLTDAQWHLALLLFLLVVIPSPRHLASRLLQYAILLLGGLSGPFSLFLSPIAWWHTLTSTQEERRRCAIQAGLLSVTAAIQTVFIALYAGSGRNSTSLGASVPTLVHILVNQIFLGSIFGSRVVRYYLHLGILQYALACAALLLGSWGLFTAWQYGSSLYRKFALFSILILAASLKSPVISYGMPQWVSMETPGNGGRYFFFPILMCFCAVLVLASRHGGHTKTIGKAILPFFLIGMLVDWHYDFHAGDTYKTYQIASSQFAHANPGVTVTFPEEPIGWKMVLVKR